MKHRLIVFLFIAAPLIVSSCSGGKNAEHDHGQASEEKKLEASAPQFDVNDNFQQQLGKVSRRQNKDCE